MLIYSVKNWGKHSCYKLKKSEDYFEFLFGILKIRDIPVPDIYDAKGKKETIFERENTCIVYESSKGDIIEITSKDFIFLIILHIDDKIKEYILNTAEFIKYTQKNEV